jgi:hypothetical protein
VLVVGTTQGKKESGEAFNNGKMYRHGEESFREEAVKKFILLVLSFILLVKMGVAWMEIFQFVHERVA